MCAAASRLTAPSPWAARPRSSAPSCAPTWTSGRSWTRGSNSWSRPERGFAYAKPSSGPDPEFDQVLAACRVIFHAPLQSGDGLGHGEGEEEHDDDERPELLHEEVLGVELE